MSGEEALPTVEAMLRDPALAVNQNTWNRAQVQALYHAMHTTRRTQEEQRLDDLFEQSRGDAVSLPSSSEEEEGEAEEPPLAWLPLASSPPGQPPSPPQTSAPFPPPQISAAVA